MSRRVNSNRRLLSGMSRLNSGRYRLLIWDSAAAARLLYQDWQAFR